MKTSANVHTVQSFPNFETLLPQWNDNYIHPEKTRIILDQLVEKNAFLLNKGSDGRSNRKEM